MQDESLKSEAVKYVYKEEFIKNKKDHTSEINDLVRLYLQIRKDQNIGKFFLEKFSKLNKINLVKFLHFGLIHKFIRRAHEYIVFQNNNSDVQSQNFFTDDFCKKFFDDNNEKNEKLIKSFRETLNESIKNSCSLDEICVKLRITKDKIKEMIKTKHIAIICK